MHEARKLNGQIKTECDIIWENSASGIAQLTLKRVGGEVTLDSYSFIPCSLSSTVGPDSTVLGPNTLNNYQPQPYTEGGDAWSRAMSMLNGTYEGANYQVDYGNVLTAMNG